MDQASKFLDITGEVVKRIHNPEQTGKTGNKYRINYLVVKWVSGRQGEYVDYVKIKILEAKKMANIRAGYIVKVPVMFSCSIRTDEVQYKVRNVNGVAVTEPSLWPEFTVIKSKEIEILNSSNDYETKETTNQQFANTIINNQAEDDLPF